MNKYMIGLVIGLLCNNTFAGGNNNQARANLYNKDGKVLGSVEFSQYKDGVLITANVTGLPAGFHGFHVHTTGLCTVTAPPAVPFASAGPHFEQVVGVNHRDHKGDFPVLLVNKNGIVKTEFKTDRFKVKDLFDANGSAVIVHADPDNYANIPGRYTPAADPATLATGDSGARVLCGVVKH